MWRRRRVRTTGELTPVTPTFLVGRGVLRSASRDLTRTLESSGLRRRPETPRQRFGSHHLRRLGGMFVKTPGTPSKVLESRSLGVPQPYTLLTPRSAPDVGRGAESVEILECTGLAYRGVLPTPPHPTGKRKRGEKGGTSLFGRTRHHTPDSPADSRPRDGKSSPDTPGRSQGTHPYGPDPVARNLLGDPDLESDRRETDRRNVQIKSLEEKEVHSPGSTKRVDSQLSVSGAGRAPRGVTSDLVVTLFPARGRHYSLSAGHFPRDTLGVCVSSEVSPPPSVPWTGGGGGFNPRVVPGNLSVCTVGGDSSSGGRIYGVTLCSVVIEK